MTAPPRQNARRLSVVQIASHDVVGGAAKVSWMLKQGLAQRGCKTTMFVGEKISNDPGVKVIKNPACDNNDCYKKQGYLYYDIRSSFALGLQKEFLEADVIHYHNLHGNYFNPFALPKLTNIKPSLWTLHDMQAVTGHCACTLDCPKWQTGCGNCPDLSVYPAVTADRTAEMWLHKKRIYDESDFELVVPSQWLKSMIEKSILAEKKIHLIHNGVDHHIFRPLDKSQCRKKFNIPQNAVVLAFSANGGLRNKLKGGDFLLATYQHLVSKYENLFFICIGGQSAGTLAGRFLQIPFMSDENLVAQLYSAVDVFVFPTLSDNCPLVVLEFMGCAIPIVSFGVGGVPELVENGKTGFIAPSKNAQELIRLTEHLVLNEAKRREFSRAALEKFNKMFTLDRMLDGYVSLYEKLIEQNRSKNYVPPADKAAFTSLTDNKNDGYLVSAIVSAYNSEKFIRGCLDDLENQTIADKLEIIVVNSGSQQNEESVVREYQQKYNNIVYLKTEQREGIYSAWNRAVKIARGQFITNANTDDRHSKDALEIMADTLLKNPDVALVYGDQICTDTPNGTFENHHPVEMARRADYSRERLLFGCCVGSQPMWRKSLHNELGYFDETLTCAADWDFWLRISSKYKLKHIPEFLGLYYHNPDGIEHGRKIHSLYERYIVGKRYGNPYISVIPRYQSSDNPLVSVIMPAYNASAYIAESIESVLIQNYGNFELIIVDDGSTDNTAEIIAAFNDPKIRYFYQANNGASSARNFAIRQARGQYLVLLDADDMITPDFIARHLQEFEKNTNADLIYSDYCFIDDNSRPIRIVKRPEYTDEKLLIRDLFRCGFPIVQFNHTCLRKSVFDRIGFYEEKLVIAEDYDMIRRFLKCGLKLRHIGQVLYLRRITTGSLSRSFTPEKANCHFEVVRRFTETFSPEELFPDIDWSSIAPDIRPLHAKCMAAVTCLSIGQAYVRNNVPLFAATAFELACSQLDDCLKADPQNWQVKQLLQKCRSARSTYSETPQQNVALAT